MGRRVVFTFDDQSLESLKELKEQGRYTSLGDAVRDTVQVRRALQRQAAQGFSEVIVRNPKTGAERVLILRPVAQED